MKLLFQVIKSKIEKQHLCDGSDKESNIQVVDKYMEMQKEECTSNKAFDTMLSYN